jgi:hypothetical protein
MHPRLDTRSKHMFVDVCVNDKALYCLRATGAWVVIPSVLFDDTEADLRYIVDNYPGAR